VEPGFVAAGAGDTANPAFNKRLGALHHAGRTITPAVRARKQSDMFRESAVPADEWNMLEITVGRGLQLASKSRRPL
jgi:hypothetical protein